MPSRYAVARIFAMSGSATTRRRIGIDLDHNEFVVFDRTGDKVAGKRAVGGVYHGHVRTWDELTSPMKGTLIEHGVVDRRGRIKVDPSRWDITP